MAEIPENSGAGGGRNAPAVDLDLIDRITGESIGGHPRKIGLIPPISHDWAGTPAAVGGDATARWGWSRPPEQQSRHQQPHACGLRHVGRQQPHGVVFHVVERHQGDAGAFVTGPFLESLQTGSGHVPPAGDRPRVFWERGSGIT